MSKEGKVFEESLESSCNDQNIFYHRIKDTYVPPDLRRRVRVTKNKYDSLLYYKNYLFPVEMKSTKENRFSFDESIIKQHQIENLKEANDYNGVIAGFIFNFRQPENRAFFVHIEDFVIYKNIAENGLDHTYKSKVNKASIPLGICEEIGIEITNIKKITKYRYYINKLLDELIRKCKE